MNTLALLDKEVGTSFVGKIPESKDDKKNLLNAMNNCDGKLSDHINEVIEVSNVFMQNVEVKNKNKKKEDDPETVMLPRVVIITPSGESYGCASRGVFNSLEKLFMVYGTPQDWKSPMKMIIKQITTSNGSMLTLILDDAGDNETDFT